MTRATHFPFYPSDWLGGVAGMKPAEVGIYINIVAMIYDAGGPIKLDEARLARRMCCPLVTFRSILSALISDEKLTFKDGFISNMRAEIELEKLSHKRLSASASAASRWQEKPNKTIGASMRTQSERNANQNQSQSYKKEIDKSISKEKRGTRLFQDWIPDQNQTNEAAGMGLTMQEIDNEAAKFRDYWIAKSGQSATKVDWSATWRNWCRNVIERRGGKAGKPNPVRDDGKPQTFLGETLRLIKEREGYGYGG